MGDNVFTNNREAPPKPTPPGSEKLATPVFATDGTQHRCIPAGETLYTEHAVSLTPEGQGGVYDGTAREAPVYREQMRDTSLWTLPGQPAVRSGKAHPRPDLISDRESSLDGWPDLSYPAKGGN